MLKRLRFLCDKEDISDIYKVLFSIDYNVNNGKGKFVSDICFSYMQWKLIEDIEKDSVNLKHMDVSALK